MNIHRVMTHLLFLKEKHDREEAEFNARNKRK